MAMTKTVHAMRLLQLPATCWMNSTPLCHNKLIEQNQQSQIYTQKMYNCLNIKWLMTCAKTEWYNRKNMNRTTQLEATSNN